MALSKRAIGELKELGEELKENRGVLEESPEEQTKQSLILPFLEILGYSTRKIGEVSWEAALQNGRIDCKVLVGNSVLLIECKKLAVKLTNTVSKQLGQYFDSCQIDNKIGIATNGDDYWFFKDGEKPGYMNPEPFYKFSLSSMRDLDFEALEQFTKEKMMEYNPSQDKLYDKFREACIEVFGQMKKGNIPDKVMNYIYYKANMEYSVSELDDSRLNEIAVEVLNNILEIKCEKDAEEANIKKDKNNSNSVRTKKPRVEHKELEIGKEYIFTDNNLADYKGCTFEYAVLMGEKIEDISGRQLLIKIIKDAIEKEAGNKEKLLEEYGGDKGNFRIVQGDNASKEFVYIKECDVSVYTKSGIDTILRFIVKIFDTLNYPYSSLVLCIKNKSELKAKENGNT